MSYYIVNQRDQSINISADEMMAEFCIPESDIAEHLRAQILHFRTTDPTHKVQPIIIGISQEKFLNVVEHLCTTYKGFLKNYFLVNGRIAIIIVPKGNEVIRIVNEDLLTQN